MPGKCTQLQRLKWFYWHGNVFCALQTLDDILVDLDITEPGPEKPGVPRSAVAGKM